MQKQNTTKKSARKLQKPRTMQEAELQAADWFITRVHRQADKMERLLRGDDHDLRMALEAVLLELSNVTHVYIWDPNVVKIFYLAATLKGYLLTSKGNRSRVDRVLGDLETILNPRTKRSVVRRIEKEYSGHVLHSRWGTTKAGAQ